ncbi:MAG: shikimate dehydrogenase [Deltaproteobacteria bacterium RBG_13_61_14]|nr:MAG: shikimate dehydrogenase [Deltaproteobacteria bacterium RBG_13_61_14]
MMDAKTKLCIIIGNPVAHSLSPAIHNAAFSALGLNFAYTAHRVEDVEAAVKGIRALGIRGASVTIPHKLAVIPYLDEVDPVASWIGSVNTIVNDGGKLLGSNTDGEGAMKALVEAGVKLPGKRVLMIGSGGAARAVGFTLAAKAKLGALTILGIIEPELKKLAGDIAEKTPVKAEGRRMKDEFLAEEIRKADLLIQCSPVGMHPKVDETPVPAKLLRKDLIVMDIVYNPRETRLLREAKAQGAQTIPGLEMFLNQAVLQFEKWTGKPAPAEIMRQVLEKNL